MQCCLDSWIGSIKCLATSSSLASITPQRAERNVHVCIQLLLSILGEVGGEIHLLRAQTTLVTQTHAMTRVVATDAHVQISTGVADRY